MKNKLNSIQHKKILGLVFILFCVVIFGWQLYWHNQYQLAIAHAEEIGADQTVAKYHQPTLFVTSNSIQQINLEADKEFQTKINDACLAKNLTTEQCTNLVASFNLTNANDIVASIAQYSSINNANMPNQTTINNQSSIFYYVNKDEENALSTDYEPNLVQLPSEYTYNKDIYVDERIYNDLIAMLDAAKNDGIEIVVGSGYRSYNQQVSTYQGWVDEYGEVEANKISAQPGHSEHQTGLAIDIMENGYDSSCYLETCFENSPAFTWMQDNAHKYGFILRYPSNKETITGYSYEPWHYRYVGKDFATLLHDNSLTFDEYIKEYL